jgi:hypothetical protein
LATARDFPSALNGCSLPRGCRTLCHCDELFVAYGQPEDADERSDRRATDLDGDIRRFRRPRIRRAIRDDIHQAFVALGCAITRRPTIDRITA